MRDTNAEAQPTLSEGQSVVVETAAGVFLAGEVVSVLRDRVRIRTYGAESIERTRADLYAVEPGGTRAPAPAPGGYVVCAMPDGQWHGCRVEEKPEGPDGLLRVIDDGAVRASLERTAWLVPTELTELNIRQRFERNAKRRAFQMGARQAGRPYAPHGWRPTFNERVLAVREGGWYGAQIRGFLKSGNLRIVWDDDKRTADLGPHDVVPQPPVDFSPTLGSYVLARPFGANKTWTVLRIESLGGGSLVLSNEVGDELRVTTRDVLPLDRAEEPLPPL